MFTLVHHPRMSRFIWMSTHCTNSKNRKVMHKKLHHMEKLLVKIGEINTYITLCSCSNICNGGKNCRQELRFESASFFAFFKFLNSYCLNVMNGLVTNCLQNWMYCTGVSWYLRFWIFKDEKIGRTANNEGLNADTGFGIASSYFFQERNPREFRGKPVLLSSVQF